MNDDVLLVYVDGKLSAVLAESHVVDRKTLVLAWLRNNGFRDTMLEKCSWTGSPVTKLSLAQLKHPPIEG